MNILVNNTEIHKLCRICLTRSQSMAPIESPLLKDPSSVSVLEAIEKVMAVKLVIDEKLPSTICAMCKGLLKISYDLWTVFNNSQATLSKHFNTIPCEKEDEVAPVELIFQNNKYNLKDVLIVEEAKEEKQNFEGFLNNLGKTVSAMFVDKAQPPKKITNNKAPRTQIEATGVQGETIIELTLEDLQGSNINDLFPDNLILENNVNIGDTSDNLLNDIRVKNLIDISSLRKMYRCTSCDIFCANRRRLKLHLKKHHLHQAPYFCEVCGSTSFTNLEGAEMGDVPDVTSCDDCGSIDTKKKILDLNSRNPVIKTDTQREYLCQLCGFISKSASNARYHHQQKHLGIRFECHLCHKTYSSKWNLDEHINGHANLRNFLCTVCGKKFNLSSALRYHMRIHSSERKYVCCYCDKKFYMQPSLKRHIRTHTGIRPNMCKHCGKTFFSAGEQQKHEKTHAAQKPYKCIYCNKGFLSSFNRKEHYMAHSGPHECDFCSRTFISVDFLTEHIKNKHSDTELRK